MTTEVAIVFWSVVAARFALPLLIPRFPLPAIIACLILDGVDQTIFQSFGFDPPGYQNYDKAMDLFYLAIAYLATMQNWTRTSATSIAKFLFFYRLVGVLLFELTGARILLLVFANTFEYFFIAYELVRSRWDPRRYALRWWLLVAAGIWVFIKLPQEYWIHIAQLDLTDTIRDVPWFAPALVVALLALAAVLWFVVWPRLDRPDWPLRLVADPLPAEMDTATKRDAWTAEHLKIRSWDTLERVVLIGLLSVIYARILPGLEVSGLRLFVGISVFVVANVAITLLSARRAGSRERLAAAFAVRVVVNIGLVLVARLVLGDGALSLTDTLFFVLLLTLLTTLQDRFAPVGAIRAEHDRRDPAPARHAS